MGWDYAEIYRSGLAKSFLQQDEEVKMNMLAVKKAMKSELPKRKKFVRSNFRKSADVPPKTCCVIAPLSVLQHILENYYFICRGRLVSVRRDGSSQKSESYNSLRTTYNRLGTLCPFQTSRPAPLGTCCPFEMSQPLTVPP